MKKFLIILFCMVPASFAFALDTPLYNDPHYYMGAGFGTSRVDFPEYGAPIQNRISSAPSFLLGYRFDRELGAEISVGSISKVSNASGQISSQALSFSGIGFRSIDPGWLSLYGKLGLTRAKTTGAAALDTMSALRTDISFGAGLSIQPSERASIRLGWDSYAVTSLKASDPGVRSVFRQNVYGFNFIVNF